MNILKNEMLPFIRALKDQFITFVNVRCDFDKNLKLLAEMEQAKFLTVYLVHLNYCNSLFCRTNRLKLQHFATQFCAHIFWEGSFSNNIGLNFFTK